MLVWREEVGEENRFHQAGSFRACRLWMDVVGKGLQAQRCPRLGTFHKVRRQGGRIELAMEGQPWKCFFHCFFSLCDSNVISEDGRGCWGP